MTKRLGIGVALAARALVLAAGGLATAAGGSGCGTPEQWAAYEQGLYAQQNRGCVRPVRFKVYDFPDFLVCNEMIDDDNSGAIDHKREFKGVDRRAFFAGEQLMFVGMNRTNQDIYARICLENRDAPNGYGVIVEKRLAPGEPIVARVKPGRGNVGVTPVKVYLEFDGMKYKELDFTITTD